MSALGISVKKNSQTDGIFKPFKCQFSANSMSGKCEVMNELT